jgi:hypothetical protein
MFRLHFICVSGFHYSSYTLIYSNVGALNFKLGSLEDEGTAALHGNQYEAT